MKLNVNGSINSSSVADRKRIAVGDEGNTLAANLADAKSVHVGQVAVLPGGSQFLRVDARRNGGLLDTCRIATRARHRRETAGPGERASVLPSRNIGLEA